MKNTQTFNLVMLPSKKASNLWLNKDNKLFLQTGGEQIVFISLMRVSVPQHLYILSDEKIVVDDWVINTSLLTFKEGLKDVEPFKAKKEYIEQFNEIKNNNKCWKKVVVTTDKSLKVEKCSNFIGKEFSLPTFNDAFLNAFVENYNIKNIVSEINLEMIDNGSEELEKLEIKTRLDNTVFIQKSKTYSQTDIDRLYQFLFTSENGKTHNSRRYSDSEIEKLITDAWHNGYWKHYEEINGEGSSSENPISALNFITKNTK